MKKIIALLTLSLFFVSCSNDSNNSNNNNPSNGNVNYYFKININGVEHKVQGNTSDFSNTAYNYLLNNNKCEASLGTITSLEFTCYDIVNPNYLSGQFLQLLIRIPNIHVGLNQADLIISQSPVWDQFLVNSAIGGNAQGSAFVENSGLYCGNSFNCQYPLFSQFYRKITVNITDLGTPTQTTADNINPNMYYGRTVKGNFSGPIYFGTGSITNGVLIWNMNTPMQFNMEFEAYRIN